MSDISTQKQIIDLASGYVKCVSATIIQKSDYTLSLQFMDGNTVKDMTGYTLEARLNTALTPFTVTATWTGSLVSATLGTAKIEIEGDDIDYNGKYNAFVLVTDTAGKETIPLKIEFTIDPRGTGGVTPVGGIIDWSETVEYRNTASHGPVRPDGTTLEVASTNTDGSIKLGVISGLYDTAGASAAVQSNLDSYEGTNNTAVALVQSNLDTHVADTSDPHNVTKAQVDLASVDDTSDADKPVSTATQAAIDAVVINAVLESELTSPTDVKALDQSVVSGASPNFTIANQTLNDSSLIVSDHTNLQDFADGVDHALLKSRGTGVHTTYVAVATAGATVFNMPEVFGEINSDEGYFDIHYTGATSIAITNVSANSTYVYLDKTGVLAQQTTTPTRQDLVRKIFLMRIAMGSNVIVGFEYFNNPVGHYSNSIRDVYTYLLSAGVPFKIGQTITGRTDNLGFDIASGTLMEFGGTGDIFNPNVRSFDAIANAEYFLLDRTTTISGGNTNLVKFWDNAGSITALGSTTCVAHRVSRFSSGGIAIQYGQGNYANMVLAKAGAKLEEYVSNPRLSDATFLGWWLIEETATATSGTPDAEFVEYTIGIQGGSSSVLSGALLVGNNLSDLLDVPTALANIGLDTVVKLAGTQTVTGSKTFTANCFTEGAFTGFVPTTNNQGFLGAVGQAYSIIAAFIVNMSTLKGLTAGGIDVQDSTGATQAKIDSDGVVIETGITKAIVSNTQTDDYTLVLADAGKVVPMNKATANVLTIPTNASVAYANGTIINVPQWGAGVTTITASGGVDLNGVTAGSGAISAQYQGITLQKAGTNEWIMSGAHGTVA